MKREEKALEDAVRLILGADRNCVFHVNVIGSGYLTQSKEQVATRYVEYGYANPGGADLVGSFRGRYVAIELKSRTGRQRDAQKKFEEMITGRGGGLYFIVRSEDDARSLLAELHRRFPS